MKNHVWRPLYVVVGIVLAIVLFRLVYVPADFGAHDRGYTFGFHRLGNEQEWQAYPAKYRDSGYCGGCHGAKRAEWEGAAHGIIPCENCHGAALEHPAQPVKLAIDRSRGQCLRCHAKLYMPSSGRHAIPGIDAERHNPDVECVACHNPHHPSLEEM